MKYCVNCSSVLDDNAHFCHVCGAGCDASCDIAEEKEFLEKTDNLLKIERILWKVEAIVMLVLACIYTVVGIAVSMIGPGIIIVIVALLTFLPLSIIAFKAAARISWYRERIYDDPISVLDRTGSIGILVFALILSGYAAIPVIINFSRTKACGEITQRIRNRQNGII